MTENKAATGQSPHSSLWTLLREKSEAGSTQRFLCDTRQRELTLERFLHHVDRGAAGFYRLGVRPESRVLWQLPNCLESVVITCALERLGASQILAPPTLVAADLTRICTREKPEMVLLRGDRAAQALAQQLQTHFPELLVVFIDLYQHAGQSEFPQWNNGEIIKSYPGKWYFYENSGALHRRVLSSRELLTRARAIAADKRLSAQAEVRLISEYLDIDSVVELTAAAIGNSCVLIGGG